MDCQTCQEYFTAMTEGDHSPTTMLAQAHLATCPKCASQYARFNQTVAALRDLPIIVPPPSLLNAITQQVHTMTSRRPPIGLWQPLTAGLSLAACLMMVLWTTVISPPPGFQEMNASQNVSVTGSAQTTTMPAPGKNATVNRVENPSKVGIKRGAGVRRVERPNSLAPQARPHGGLPPLFGGWAVSSAPTKVKTTLEFSEGSKPAGTFADPGGEVSGPSMPLVRQAGPIQLRFIPPTERRVGSTVVGELAVDSEAECEAIIGVEARRGLRVVNAPEGILYRGPIRRGDTLKLPVKLFATTSGTQRLRLWMKPDMPIGEANLELTIPSFTGQMTAVGEKLVTLRLRQTPVNQAIRQMASEAGARVVIDDEIEDQLVTQDYSAGVPFAAALRILCDSVGCQVQERDGVYHIVK